MLMLFTEVDSLKTLNLDSFLIKFTFIEISSLYFGFLIYFVLEFIFI